MLFLGFFSQIQTTQYFSELYLLSGQITASLNAVTHFSLKSSECVPLFLFQSVGRGQMLPHTHLTNDKTPAFKKKAWFF